MYMSDQLAYPAVLGAHTCILLIVYKYKKQLKIAEVHLSRDGRIEKYTNKSHHYTLFHRNHVAWKYTVGCSLSANSCLCTVLILPSLLTSAIFSCFLYLFFPSELSIDYCTVRVYKSIAFTLPGEGCGYEAQWSVSANAHNDVSVRPLLSMCEFKQL